MLKIRKLNKKEPVFDITVEDNHNFYANGILISNCTEIMEYTSADEIAVCNLASIALPKYIEYPNTKKVDKSKRSFNFQKLYDVTYQITKNLNRVIDVNYYPIPEARNSNMRHRPIGIGVQGLADLFAMLGLPFTSDEAKKLNRDIFETIYFASMTASKDLAKKEGKYESYEGSPISQGVFQFDMWGVAPSGRWDWESLRKDVLKHGVRNSLLLAPMPTASTAQILGNNEAFEAFTSNLYKRRTIAGEYTIVNKHLVEDLIECNLWSEDMKLLLIANKGSVQGIDAIPEQIREVYKTVWEMKQKDIIDMSADRGAFICQSQSLNLFIENCNPAKLTSAHFYAWKKGLKTGMYYLRTKAATEAIAGLGVDIEALKKAAETVKKQQNPHPADTVINKPKAIEEPTIQEQMACSLDDPDSCVMCSG